MYKVIKDKITVEGKEYTTYGMSYSDDLCIKDISTDKAAVEKLVTLCNEGELDPNHLYDLAEDFIADV